MLGKFLKLIQCVSLLSLLGTTALAEDPPKKQPLALINGEAIAAEEVEKPLGVQLSRLEEQIYALKRQKLEALIQTRLLAKEAANRGLTIPALLDAEVTPKVSPVTEQDIENHYQANRAKYPGERDTYSDAIRSQLRNQRQAAQREAFLRSLRSQANVVIHLKPPPTYRADVGVQGAPIRGSTKAPVTIVEFSDFHCPYCRQVQPTLTRLLSDYGDQVKLAYRDFPIDQLHPSARKAAEAARCANEQGKFWEYHDKLYLGGADASPEKLRALAQETGMNVSVFEQCFASGKYRSEVDKDIAEATDLGVTGTPSFFINGRPLSGAQAYESFVGIINDELARSGQKSTGQAPR
jgi:protein-disulfide isomerase